MIYRPLFQPGFDYYFNACGVAILREHSKKTIVDFTIYRFLVNLSKIRKMKNTSVSLGNYFDQFVSSQIAAGRYKNVSEVIRAGLRLLENEENKMLALRNAIQKGLDSPRVENFDFEEHLAKLKSESRKNGESNIKTGRHR